MQIFRILVNLVVPKGTTKGSREREREMTVKIHEDPKRVRVKRMTVMAILKLALSVDVRIILPRSVGLPSLW